MPSVSALIRWLLPQGSIHRNDRPDWQDCPKWPPDAFAVAACILDRSGAYTGDRYSGRADGAFFGETYRNRVHQAAKRWQRTLSPPPRVQHLWRQLQAATLAYNERTLINPCWDAAMELLAIADAAAEGIGFGRKDFSGFVDYAFHRYAFTGPEQDLRYTLCERVPKETVCVQPKANTAQCGCTLESLSHHLALLPAWTQVQTTWDYEPYCEQAADKPLCLLLIPFPYHIKGDAFRALERIDDAGSKSSHFEIRQTWLRDTPQFARELTQFTTQLIQQACREVGRIDGVVFPELALSEAMAIELAKQLGTSQHVSFFISGASRPSQGCDGPRNLAFFASFNGNRAFFSQQAKHHRWVLDASQVERYAMSHALTPNQRWWEKIDISRRSIGFFALASGVSVASLVCEDLARQAPIQPIVRAIGPSLVVALLQDGPQLGWRWPGRYATVLADDPGCAVLTMTSLGMIRRSTIPGEPVLPKIALWKDPKTGTQELSLPPDAHALALVLHPVMREHFTLDGRGDGGTTTALALGSQRSVKHPNPPEWLFD